METSRLISFGFALVLASGLGLPRATAFDQGAYTFGMSYQTVLRRLESKYDVIEEKGQFDSDKNQIYAWRTNPYRDFQTVLF